MTLLRRGLPRAALIIVMLLPSGSSRRGRAPRLHRSPRHAACDGGQGCCRCSDALSLDPLCHSVRTLPRRERVGRLSPAAGSTSLAALGRRGVPGRPCGGPGARTAVWSRAVRRAGLVRRSASLVSASRSIRRGEVLGGGGKSFAATVRASPKALIARSVLAATIPPMVSGVRTRRRARFMEAPPGCSPRPPAPRDASPGATRCGPSCQAQAARPAHASVRPGSVGGLDERNPVRESGTSRDRPSASMICEASAVAVVPRAAVIAAKRITASVIEECRGARRESPRLPGPSRSRAYGGWAPARRPSTPPATWPHRGRPAEVDGV